MASIQRVRPPPSWAFRPPPAPWMRPTSRPAPWTPAQKKRGENHAFLQDFFFLISYRRSAPVLWARPGPSASWPGARAGMFALVIFFTCKTKAVQQELNQNPEVISRYWTQKRHQNRKKKNFKLTSRFDGCRNERLGLSNSLHCLFNLLVGGICLQT